VELKEEDGKESCPMDCSNGRDQPGIIWSFEQGVLAELDQQPYKVWLQFDPDCHSNKTAFDGIRAKGGCHRSSTRSPTRPVSRG